MRNRIFGRTARLIGAILPIFAACASVSQQSAAPVLDKQQVVAKLAQSRWDDLVKRDFDGAYKLMSPASRDFVTLDAFRRRFAKVTWKSGKVGKVECAADDLCKVHVKAKYSYMVLRLGREVENDQRVTETWRNIAGNWWYVPADAL